MRQSISGVALLLMCVTACGAEVIRVAPGQSVQAALDAAGPGDTVLLEPGVHRERVVMPPGGRHGAPVTLEGLPGAVLDGSEPVELDWRPAEDVAPGVWRAHVPFMPFLVTAEGRIITMLSERRVDPDTVDDPAWGWPRIFRDGVGPSGWDAVRALGMYRHAQRELLLKFGAHTDPRTVTITVAPREPCVHILDADRSVVRNLAMRYGAYGVLIEEAMGAVVEGCTIGPVDYGVWLGAGSYACTVRFNEISGDPYAVTDTWERGSWDNWQAHKRGGFHDRYGVQIHRSAGHHRVHDNLIRDVWDGIEDRGGAGENQGLRIHHNLITRVADDGLEPNGAEEDCHWHDNIVTDAICGFRIKAPTVGPLYAYRNIFFNCREDFRNFGSVELQPATVYVYHNTSTASSAIVSNKVWGIGTPNYHYHNNLFHCARWWGNHGDSVEPNWHGDHNVYCRRGDSRAWDEGISLAARLGLDPSSLWTEDAPGFRDLANRDVSLLPDSPAIGRGGDLRAIIGVDLPGLPDKHPPDAGALQLGEAMPVLPRPREEVAVEPAGSWPGPDAARPRLWADENLLANGDFEQGAAGWEGLVGPVFELREGEAARGSRRLVVDAREQRSDMRRDLEGLEAGRRYWLVYRSRVNTIGDLRVIVRCMDSARYLTQGGAAPGGSWRRTALSFTAPGGPVRLELSPRTAGRCELDDFAVHAAR